MNILIQYTLIYAATLSLVALGGMFAERSGVINLGLEGCMVIGALGGALIMQYLPTNLNAFLVIVIVFGISMLSGILYSLLLAVASVTFKSDQTITGTALNILAPAFATVIVKSLTLARDGKAAPRLDYIDLQKKFIFNIGKLELNWFIVVTVLLVIISYIILYKTKFGLRLMSCGEHPQAAASVGINVIKMRYIGVIISGALGGLGGIAFIASANSTWSFNNGVAGFGFLALAVMIFGKWKPISIFLGALLFGFFRALGAVYTSFDWLQALNMNPSIYKMLPYIVCLIVLGFTSRKSYAPKAEGIPYEPGQR